METAVPDAATILKNLTPPRPRPETAIICFDDREASRFRRQIASRDKDGKLIYPPTSVTNPDFIVIHVGQAVQGHRWKNVLLPYNTRYQVMTHGRSDLFERWLRECIQCRLLPGGQVIELP